MASRSRSVTSLSLTGATASSLCPSAIGLDHGSHRRNGPPTKSPPDHYSSAAFRPNTSYAESFQLRVSHTSGVSRARLRVAPSEVGAGTPAGGGTGGRDNASSNAGSRPGHGQWDKADGSPRALGSQAAGQLGLAARQGLGIRKRKGNSVLIAHCSRLVKSRLCLNGGAHLRCIGGAQSRPCQQQLI